MIHAYHQEHPSAPLDALCRSLRISRSWYYAHTAAPETTQDAVHLRDAIEQLSPAMAIDG